MEPGTVLFPGKLMQNELTKEILDYVETALGVAQIGLTYSTNEFDIGRFIELRALSARLLAKLENESVEKVSRWIAYDENYATPKVDVRAMVYDEHGHILLVREKSDGGWTLPGGWCDTGESPSLSAEREVAEESGLQVRAVRLVAPLHFGRAVKHIIANVIQFVHKRDGLFGQTAVRGAASCLRCAVSVVAHAFFPLGRFSVFSLWFRGMRDNVYQFVNATFHNGIGIAQHSVKHLFHGSQYNSVLYKSAAKVTPRHCTQQKKCTICTQIFVSSPSAYM